MPMGTKRVNEVLSFGMAEKSFYAIKIHGKISQNKAKVVENVWNKIVKHVRK